MTAKKQATIPMRTIGPINIIGPELNAGIKVPLATLETPLWPSVSRGAKISRHCAGINAVITRDCMTRSVLLQGSSAQVLNEIVAKLTTQQDMLQQVVAATSRFATLQAWQSEIVGNLLYLRFAFQTGDAAGHNIVTKAADALINWLLHSYSELSYISVSANYCVDKKVSAVNGILGRGKSVVAEILVPANICQEYLRTTPERIVELHQKKNLLGSIVAGSIRSANAHFANMLLALYLATGQDAANIVEGSQGIVHAEMRGSDLYFSVTVANIIVGTVGAKCNLDYVRENLQLMGCYGATADGKNARRLAIIAAATVLCGELSLLAAQTNPGELMRSHVTMERGATK